MKPSPVAYLSPHTIEEAVAALQADPDGKVLAGGQSLVPLLAMRLAAPTVLIDLSRVEGLTGVTYENGELVIGAMTTQRQVERDALVAQHAPMIPAALAHVAHPAVRARGTVGGSVAHADPSAEMPTVMLALGAAIEATGPNGTRRVPVAELFDGPYMTVLEPEEILTRLFVPSCPTGWGFQEVARRPGDFALTLVAVTLDREGDACTGARIVIGAAVNTTERASKAEEALIGRSIDADVAREVGAIAAESIDAVSDIHGDAPYRRSLVRQLLERALLEAWEVNR